MKITFLPQNIDVPVNPDKTLLQIAQENNIKIKSICNGKPSCSECRVKIVDGFNNVPAPGKEELNLIGTTYYIDGRRLSCQVRCYGSVTVDLAEQLLKSDSHKKIKGVKTKDQKDVQARQDTFILTDNKDQKDQREQRQQVRIPDRPGSPRASSDALVDADATSGHDIDVSSSTEAPLRPLQNQRQPQPQGGGRNQRKGGQANSRNARSSGQPGQERQQRDQAPRNNSREQNGRTFQDNDPDQKSNKK